MGLIITVLELVTWPRAMMEEGANILLNSVDEGQPHLPDFTALDLAHGHAQYGGRWHVFSALIDEGQPHWPGPLLNSTT